LLRTPGRFTPEHAPKHADSPDGIKSLWFEIENICKGAQDFYGGPFYKEEPSPFKEYLWYPGHKGSKYQPRLRLTEKNCQNQVTTPTTCFKFLGSNQVGSGSIAGMRFLHALEGLRKEGKIAIWPFDRVQNAVLTVVEIFPRLYERQGFEMKGRNEHETDALTSAEALRQLSENERLWNIDAINNDAKEYEGWIFGVI